MRKFEFLRGYGKARAPWLFLGGRGSLEGPLSIWRGISNDFFLPLSSPLPSFYPRKPVGIRGLRKRRFSFLLKLPSYQRSHFALTHKRPSMDRRSVTSSPMLRWGSTRISDCSRFKETRFRFFVRTYRLNLLPFGARDLFTETFENFAAWKPAGRYGYCSVWLVLDIPLILSTHPRKPYFSPM